MKFIAKLRNKLILNEMRKIVSSIISSEKKATVAAISRLITAYHTNSQTFPKFKNCYKGKSLVIVGAGPSVNMFKPELLPEDCIYIGLNRAFKLEKINFDILFAIDYMGIRDFREDFFNYHPDTCIKFIGDQNLGRLIPPLTVNAGNDVPLRSSYQIPESYISGKNIYRYITTAGIPISTRSFVYHIDSEPLCNFATVSLQAMQFALWTNPKRVYLVGIDCSTDGHFTGKENFSGGRTKDVEKKCAESSIEDWKNVKYFLESYYPDTEIISVNPVRLRGVFTDWDQDETLMST